MVTLFGMWLIPVVMSARNHWWRFVLIWLAATALCSFVTKRALEQPVARTTPRLVYKFFLLAYKASYAMGIAGYAIMMATFMGLYLFFGVKPHIWMDVGILLMFYALYYGVMARDFAEICAEKMAAK